MPTYQYLCNDCGFEFERVQKFSDDPLKVCPNCEKESVRRVIHPAGIVFKGSGWYVTDSKATNAAGATPAKAATDKADSTAKTSEASSGDSTSTPAPTVENKPAPKVEPASNG
ncbi:MAG TPA: zinc ribbon domain-containing protein [Anaerolineales bacterium]|nr:zinc ribbon domain-containing protein [Anaerolineales bacterium]